MPGATLDHILHVDDTNISLSDLEKQLKDGDVINKIEHSLGWYLIRGDKEFSIKIDDVKLKSTHRPFGLVADS